MDERGSVFLVVVDGSPEFPAALTYAACLARARPGARLGLLKVVPPQDFQHWGGVEARLEAEARAEAEKALTAVAEQVAQVCPQVGTPLFYIEKGDARDAVRAVLEAEGAVCLLVLAGGTGGPDTGPLVTYFTGRGLATLHVPVVVVPGHLTRAEIEGLLSP